VLLLPKKEDNPYKDICCARCYAAKSDVKKCKCRCQGAHHGQGHRRMSDDNDKLLPETEAQRFRAQYTRTSCDCGHDLSKEPISYYVPHPDGWTIPQETERVWLFVHCPKCGFDMSIWKLGVPRE